ARWGSRPPPRWPLPSSRPGAASAASPSPPESGGGPCLGCCIPLFSRRPQPGSGEMAGSAEYTGVDFYDIDSLLSEEERAVRDTVRQWVTDSLVPVIGKAYDEAKFPKELIPGMAELGLFGANLPEEYGCAGLNNVAYGLIMQELERGDSGIRSFASVQGALVMYPIFAFGSEEQK